MPCTVQRFDITHFRICLASIGQYAVYGIEIGQMKYTFYIGSLHRIATFLNPHTKSPLFGTPTSSRHLDAGTTPIHHISATVNPDHYFDPRNHSLCFGLRVAKHPKPKFVPTPLGEIEITHSTCMYTQWFCNHQSEGSFPSAMFRIDNVHESRIQNTEYRIQNI